MTFGQRLKKDRRFRIQVILIIIVAVIMWANGGEEKKETKTFAECDQYNGFAISCILDWYWTWEDGSLQYGCSVGDDKLLCETNGCVIAEVVKQGVTNPDVCVPYALNGWIVANVDACKSGCSELIGEDIVCRECEQGETPSTCNSRERSIANIWGNTLPQLGCKTKYYITVFGGGFLALMLMLAVL